MALKVIKITHSKNWESSKPKNSNSKWVKLKLKILHHWKNWVRTKGKSPHLKKRDCSRPEFASLFGCLPIEFIEFCRASSERIWWECSHSSIRRLQSRKFSNQNHCQISLTTLNLYFYEIDNRFRRPISLN